MAQTPFIPARTIGDIVNACIENRAHIATKFVSEKLIVRATRTLFRKKIPPKNDNVSITLTIGRPNAREREFIKDAKKAGEPFPIKRVILKFPPEPRKKKK